ncbi:hypothetical protein F5Y01DRAFT_323443 [Xylaria sp. FL0043]|nr:hypothetical protein F5Y01DRAFT_323443 [Xylaria sp. FL0043]
MSSSSSSSTYPFPDLPISGLTFPHSPITTAAFAHTKRYTTEAIYNHCARSACFALLLSKKLALNPDPETVVLAPLTFSLAPFGSAEVAAVSLGVMADFQGPRFAADPWGDPAKRVDTPGAVITVDEFREVMAAFPYAQFGEERAKEIFCGLSRDKPATTFDNFVSGLVWAGVRLCREGCWQGGLYEDVGEGCWAG